MEKILTIIIPAYNMEKFLPYCLDSLLIESRLDEVEVLVINDGSTDRTSAIAHEYEERLHGVVRVIDKNNGNYGSCINVGLKEATGRYIKILDADDSFDTDNFGLFISFLTDADADLIVSDYDIVDENRKISKSVSYDLPLGTYSIEDICVVPAFMDMQMHGVAYKRNLLLQLEYVQTEGISYTDHQWILTPMIAVKTVSYFGKPLYRYLVGREGQTMNPEVKARRISHISECALAMCRDYERLKEHVSDALRPYLYGKMLYMLKEVYVFCFMHYSPQLKNFLCKFDECLKSTSMEVYLQVSDGRESRCNYINCWRIHKDINVAVVRILSKCYMLVIALKNRKNKI